ncbi:MAG: gamma carbonic anhydrase family protein [Dehalococcoidia bacterium]|nr:gamma carbonic anhydrase family protein [Dehalococcoidia bacterium]
MPVYEFEGKRPRIGATSYIHPTAVIIGDVEIGEGCWIGPNVTIRADNGWVRIAEKSNVQDNSVLHGNTTLGPYSHLGHSVVIHGATLGVGVLVAIHATVLDGAIIGDGCVIAAGAVVAPRAEVPAGKMVMGVPAAIVGDAPPRRGEGPDGTNSYLTFPFRYPKGLRELSPEEFTVRSGV